MSEKVYSINPNEIIIPERQRKKISKKPLEELAADIDKNGQYHPGVCYLDEDNTPVLIMGERRLQACKLIDKEYRYILRDEVTDEVELYEIELMENLLREDLTWQEEVDAKLRLHELREKQKGKATAGRGRGGQSLQDTADELGESRGLISKDMELAMFAREIPEVRDAPSKTVAKAVVERIKNTLKREEALDNALERSREFQKSTGGDEEELPSGISIESGIDEGASRPVSSKEKFEARLAEFDKRHRLGKLEEISEEFVAPESIDVVIFDPPWGVDFDKVQKVVGSQKRYADSEEFMKENLPKWLKKLYSLMAPDSHLYMFFGIVHHAFVYERLEEAGFMVNRMPIIWYKKGAHRTRNPYTWPGRSYEPIAFARKGKRPLAVAGMPDMIQTAQPLASMKKEHPSAKHPDVYLDLLKRSCTPGCKVLDPMSGSGMCGVACDYLLSEFALDWKLNEMDEDYRNLALFNLTLGYYGLLDKHLNAPKETVSSGGYKELSPGSDEWKAYWKDHPEEQDEMLKWKAEQKGA